MWCATKSLNFFSICKLKNLDCFYQIYQNKYTGKDYPMI